MQFVQPYFWNSKNKIYILWCLALYPLSAIIQILFYIKKFFTKVKLQHKICVICVGNIYIGGTGKTPLAIKINEILNKKYLKPIIIKKFYKDQEDEVSLIKSKTKKLIVNKSRAKALNLALKKRFNIAILDDGLQDTSIEKQIKIICFGNQWIGNGWTIPSGPLREPLSSIAGANIAIINNSKGHPNKNYELSIKAVDPKIKIFYSKYDPDPKVIKKFKNKKVLAFAGIGNPKNFFNLLIKNNVQLMEQISFPDHYMYSKEELLNLINKANDNKLDIVTTEKDYFRIKKYGFKQINFIPVLLTINKEKNLINELEKLIR